MKNDEFADLYADEIKGEGQISGEGFVDECQVESDLELLLPANYVTGSSERMLLYRELDGLMLDKDVEAFPFPSGGPFRTCSAGNGRIASYCSSPPSGSTLGSGEDLPERWSDDVVLCLQPG